MKIKSISISLFFVAALLLFAVSCKDKNAESKPESHTELHASAAYQCPMDCEDGKTYEEAPEMYKKASTDASASGSGPEDGPGTTGGESAGSEEKVVDAEFEEVDKGKN